MANFVNKINWNNQDYDLHAQEAEKATAINTNTAIGSSTKPVYINANGAIVETDLSTVYVAGPASAVAEHIATFDGTTGKTMKDSGFTIATSVPAGAVFTDTVTTATTTGDGNAITAISADNGALSITKGTTFLTEHQDISGKMDKPTVTTTSSVTPSMAGATFTVSGYTVTSYTKCDVQLTAAQITAMADAGCTGIFAVNNNGTLTMYTAGADYPSASTFQVTLYETV